MPWACRHCAMLTPMRSISVALLLGLLVGCTGGPGTTPSPTGSPTAGPTPTPTPSPTPTPTSGDIEHSTDPSAVVLRMESGGGLMPMEFFLTQAPQFTLYGDGTVIYQQIDTRANDPMGGQGMLPYLVGHLDEDGIQALLRFALGEGRLLNANADYENNMVADASTTTFTLNAGGLAKTVSVYALGIEDPNLPGDVADRRGFQKLADTLAGFERRGTNGELGDITPYDPAFYRVFLLEAQGEPVVPPLEWPWPDLTPADFKTVGDDNRPKANLDKAHVAKLETVPTGGRSGLYVKTTDAVEHLYSVGIRPLFPDELTAAGLS
jgi:hypothetical protein